MFAINQSQHAITQDSGLSSNAGYRLSQKTRMGVHQYKSNCNSNTWGVLQSYYSQERNYSSHHNDSVKLLVVAISNHNPHKLKEKEELPL
jgi:hypothetical protein